MADTLPTELIERILGFAASIDAATGHAVCLTNRLGHRVGQPVLYHTLNLGGDNSDDEKNDFEDGDEHEDESHESNWINPRIAGRLRRWSLLCRTLLEHRSLARQVVAIKAYLDYTSDKLDSQFNRITTSVYYVPALNIKAWKAFMTTELRLSKHKRIRVSSWLEKWVRNGEDESDTLKPASTPDVYLSLLILACPHLRTLRISGTPPEQLWPLTELSHALHDTLPRHVNICEHPTSGFSNIEEVFLDSGDSFVEIVGQLLRWPALKKFEVDDLGAANNLFSSLGPPFLSGVTELRITNAIISIDKVSILFGPSTLLKSFFMSWHEVCDVYREVDWHKLGAAFMAWNPLLEEIHLDIAHEVDLRDNKCGVTVPNNFDELDEGEQAKYLEVNNQGIGSLQGLIKLRKLSAPYIALFGVFDNVEERDREWTLAELLPSSLEELNIFCGGADFKDTDMALLNAPGTSGLRDITIWNCTRDRWISRVRGEGQSG